jgi:deoxyribose-phosphate aldolase
MAFQRALKNEVTDFIHAVQDRHPTEPSVESSSLSISRQNLASTIDHTLLRADATADEVRRACEDALLHGFATVCLNSAFIELASGLLVGSSTRPISVVGFPLGAALSSAKAFEAREAIRCGATEIDMVIALGALKSGDYAAVLADLQAVVAAGAPVKVILETCLLTEEQKLAGCFLAQRAGAAFVKTSTGFSTGGATEADIRLMRLAVGPRMGVKASGGVRTRQDALSMIAAGANRIGASSSVAIVTSAPTSDATGPGSSGY